MPTGHRRLVPADLVVDGMVLSDRVEDIRQDQLMPRQLGEKASLGRLAQFTVGVVTEGQDRRLGQSSFLAVVIDLFSRQVVGWSMQPTMHVDLALNALLMAVWKRKPKNGVVIHSDQGSQYTSGDWQAFLKSHNLVCSMSRRGNCYDNAVAESFFQLLKRERIKRKTYKNREEAKQDIFNYIEMFYNPVRRHGYNNDLSPVEFERRHFMKTASV
jgi:transposase InsO family protein